MARYIVFDVETPNEKNSRMSAIGISVIENGKIIRDYYSLVNPETTFADFNIRLTGITPEAAGKAPTFPEIWREIEPLMSSGTLVAHNAPFDLSVLAQCLFDYGISWKSRVPYLCTVQMGRKLLPGMSHRLNVLCEFYGIELNHHQADSDSRACAEILLRYLETGEKAETYLRTWNFRSSAGAVSSVLPAASADRTEGKPDGSPSLPASRASDSARKILQEVYGHAEFRTGQQEIIESLLRKQDAFCVMPTGSGKSLCYQIPALALPGTTIVISPLISLMKDQVIALQSRGISAACLNSSMTWSEAAEVRKRAGAGRYKILYVAPERLQSPDFPELVRQMQIPFVAVDEAHCISQWGQDFRPSYLRIPEFIAGLAERPVVGAFTATATPRVRKDILSNLGLLTPVCVTTSFDRPNLSFSVYEPKDKDQTLRDLLRDRYRQSGIVYCATRKNVESVCEMLEREGFSATRYHAGLEKEERSRNQEDFLFDRRRVMVATNAFGMGIDKSNVSFVIHYNMPMSLEAYYQEAGRAGRDGCDADCILLYSGQDVMVARWLLDHGEENPDLTPEQQETVRAENQERLKRMTFYARSRKCLRRDILRYFGEDGPENCGNCSNCVPDCEHVDITIPAQMILSSIVRTGQRLPEKTVIDLLRGLEPENLPADLIPEKLTTFGLMKGTGENQLAEQIRALSEQGYLDRDADDMRILRLNQASGEVLFRNRRVTMRRNAGSRQAMPGNEDLLQALRHLRYLISGEEHIAASALFEDATLQEICRVLPRDRKALAGVEGMGIYKANRYGDRILDILRRYQPREKDTPAREERTRTPGAGGNGSCRAQVTGAGNTSAYASWTAEEDAQLAEEFRQHRTPKEMSEIHHRTRGAILKRLQKLKLI